MSDPLVSSYDEKFMEAFGRGALTIPENKAKIIKDMVEKIHEDVISQIEYYVIDELKMNVNGAIRQEASEVARSMLMNALAGDDKEIRNLFGFNEWYMKHVWNFDRLPTQWALIDALIDRRPELFVDERIKQREAEIEGLQAKLKRANEECERLREIVGSDR